MTWVLVIGASWLLVSLLVAVVIGRSIRLADGHPGDVPFDEPNFIAGPMTDDRSSERPEVWVDPGPEHSVKSTRPVRETPTIPGLPVARPRVPRSRPDVRRPRRTGTE